MPTNSEDRRSPDHRALLRDALRSVERAQEKLEATRRERNEPIAVVGVGCRFPGGADGPERFWELLSTGTDAVREVPSDRWPVDAYFDDDPTAPGSISTREGGFLDDVSRFDARFFGISPREARSMDPQQRLILEVIWQALEGAGIPGTSLKGTPTGVFVGIGSNDFALLRARTGSDAGIDAYTGSGGGVCFAAGRVSYALGLEGPSLIVDTACSSSLVALHLACESLRRDECRTALAAGVNLILSPLTSLFLSRTGALAPDGRCKAFDASADGFGRGEGCGAVVLKRLSAARSDGDDVLAVVLGSAVNQDGRSSGITVPNGPAQRAVLRRALERAGVEPGEVGYVEAHGTGTPLGDPIEMSALSAVLGEARDDGAPLRVGSVKTNLGHLEAAAGIAGLIKAVLAVRHGAIPPSLHFREWNPEIALDGAPIRVPTRMTDWPSNGGRRVAGVSSFGLSGTNAHVVLAQAPAGPGDEAGPGRRGEAEAGVERPDLLLLSARDEEALEALAGRFDDHLARAPEASLRDVCATLQTGRSHFEHRLAVVLDGSGGPGEALGAFPGAHPALRRGRVLDFEAPTVAFLFTGQGAQYPGMGRGLREAEPVFRRALERCQEILRPELDVPLLDLLDGTGRSEGLLDRTAYTQPALFSVEYALAELWRSWGVRPGAVLGHSIGEYVAACLAGVFELEDALRLVALRGRLMQSLPPGGIMAAVQAPEERVRALLSARAPVSVAAVNGPLSTVVSGAAGAVEDVLRKLGEVDVGVRRLRVSHAFHSPLMDPILDEFEAAVAAARPKAPSLEMISNVTGRTAGAEVASARYWRDHVRSTVRFRDSVEVLGKKGYRTFLEVGPHPTLVNLARRCVSDPDLTWAGSLRRNGDDEVEILGGLAELHVAGVPVRWEEYRRHRGGRRVGLPTYPFRGPRLPVRPEGGVEAGPGPRGPGFRGGGHPLLGRRTEVATKPGTHLWEIRLDPGSLPWLEDHRVQEVPVVPATAYVEMAVAAASELAGEGPTLLRDVGNERVLLLSAESPPVVQLELRAVDERAWEYRVLSREPDAEEASGGASWTLHASGVVRRVEAHPEAEVPPEAPDAVRRRCGVALSGEEFYRIVKGSGNDWGPAFRAVQRLRLGRGEALAEGRCPEQIRDDLRAYVLHPALADATGHVLSAAALDPQKRGPGEAAVVAERIEELRVHRPLPAGGFRAHASLRAEAEGQAPDRLVGDVVVFDEEGAVVSETRGVRLRYLQPGEGPHPESLEGWLHEVAWTPAAGAPTPTGTATSDLLVVLSPEGPISETLGEGWRDEGRPCVVVRTSDEFRRVSAERYDVRAGVPGDLARVLDDVESVAAGRKVTLVSLLALAAPAHERAASAGSGLTAELEASLLLVQEVVRRTEAGGTRLWLVTRGGQPVAGAEPRVDPLQSALWGFGRTVAVEHAEIWGGMIDLSPGVAPSEAAAQIGAEIRAPDGEDQVGYRAGERYVARLRRLPPSTRSDDAVPIREDATYLITGGLGGLGSAVGAWLAERGARHLVLASRTGLPPRGAWDDPGHDEETRRRIAHVRSLEETGVSVHPVELDVADRDALDDFVRTLRAGDHPPVRGVVHAAGVARYAALMDHTPSDLAEVARSKILGTALLDREFDDDVDFFVMFSSAASVLNAALMCGYAAANAYLDGLAHHRRSRGSHGLSVDWGAWADAGMAVDFVNETGGPGLPGVMRAISPGRGLRALEHLLARDATQVCVTRIDWEEVGRIYPAFAALPILRDLGPDSKRTSASVPVPALDRIRSAEPGVREEALREYAAARVADVLGFSVDELDVTRSVNHQGFDSMMALELKNHLERDLEVVVPLVRLLDGPSVADLARLLADEVGACPGAGAATADEPATRGTGSWVEGEI